MANLDIMSVRQMIDNTFGPADYNTVNFKLLQTILHILARQLKILNRHVAIEVARRQKAAAKIMVTELKIHSKSKKKGRKGKDQPMAEAKSQFSSDDLKSSGKAAPKATTDESSAGKYSTEKSAKKSATEKYEKYSTGTSRKSSATSMTDSDKMKSGGSKKRSKDRTETSSEDDRDSTEIIHEKLLIVSSDYSPYSDGDQQGSGAGVATQDQFNFLLGEICQLQALFGIDSDITDTLRAQLYTRTSMTHPMAAVNMSARLEAAERQLAKLLKFATELAKRTPGVDLASAFDDSILKQKRLSEWDPPGLSSQTPPPLSKSAAFKQPPRRSTGGTQQSRASNFNYVEEDLVDESEEESAQSELTGGVPSERVKVVKVTYDELNGVLDELYEEVVNKATGVTTRSSTISDASYKMMVKIDEKLEAALGLGDKFTKLDVSVEDYVDTVNYIDTTLGSKMTEYQDSLTQMQYDLEVGLDSLAEALAAPSEDVAAIAELNGKFTYFQVDINYTAESQRELKLLQKTCGMDLDDLKRRLKELQDKKTTREEAEEALNDKASISALNGLVRLDQFDAVRGDFEKRIIAAFDSFNNKEIAWQKILEDTIRSINDKGDLVQMVSLKQEIEKYLTKLMSDLKDLKEVLGEIEMSTITKKLERFDNCLCCGTGIDIEVDEDILEDMLPRPPVIGAESTDVKEDATRKFCVPGQPVPHPIDPRAIHCQHYCGAPARDHDSSMGVTINKMKQPQSNSVGTDTKNPFP